MLVKTLLITADWSGGCLSRLPNIADLQFSIISVLSARTLLRRRQRQHTLSCRKTLRQTRYVVIPVGDLSATALPSVHVERAVPVPAHGGIGVLSFDAGALVQNLEALMVDVNKAKPASAKGVYIKKIVVSSTMGPGLIIDQASLSA